MLYAGNVGFSQSLDLLLAAARALPEVTFLINGNGAARAGARGTAAGLANVRFADYIEPASAVGTVGHRRHPRRAAEGRVSRG